MASVSAPFAVLDIGTNTVNVLVVQADGARERSLAFPRLGQDWTHGGELLPASVERTATAIADLRRDLEGRNIPIVACVATAAVRGASNGADVAARLGAAAGVAVKVIAGAEESRLAFAGAVAGLPTDGTQFLVVDIGGGSTEFAIGSADFAAGQSLNMGAVQMTHEYLQHDPPLPEELSGCLTVAGIHLDDLLRDLPDVADATALVAIAGTATTAAAVELGVADPAGPAVDRFVLTKPAAEDVFRTLATESVEQRLFNPGLLPGREDVIVGGMCILVAIMRRLGFDSCIVRTTTLGDAVADAVVAGRWESAGADA